MACLTGLGRLGYRENLYSFANYGADQALVSRYVTISTPLWLAIFVLAALRLSRLRIDRAAAAWPTSQWLISAALVAIVASTVASGKWGTEMSNARRERFQPARRALITGQDDALLLRLYPILPAVRARREMLIVWHYSVFRSARAQRD